MLDCFKKTNTIFQNQFAKAIKKNNDKIAFIERRNDILEEARDRFAMLLDKAWDVADGFAFEADSNYFNEPIQGVTLEYGSYKVDISFDLRDDGDIEVSMGVYDGDDGAIFEDDWSMEAEDTQDFESFLLDGFNALAGVLNEEM